MSKTAICTFMVQRKGTSSKNLVGTAVVGRSAFYASLPGYIAATLTDAVKVDDDGNIIEHKSGISIQVQSLLVTELEKP